MREIEVGPYFAVGYAFANWNFDSRRPQQDRLCRQNFNIEVPSRYYCCREKEELSILRVCVCVSVFLHELPGMQIATFLLSIIWPWSMSSPAVPSFYTLPHTGTIFGGECTERKMCVLIFSITFVWNIRTTTEWHIVIISFRCHESNLGWNML